MFRLDAVERPHPAAGVGERKVRRRRAHAVQAAHPRIPFIPFPVTVVDQVRPAQPVHEIEIQVLVADRGIRIVQVMPRQAAQFFEYVGIRKLPLEGIDPVKEAGHRLCGRVRRQLAKQRREQSHLGLHFRHRHAVDRHGITDIHFRGIRETVPEMTGRVADAFLRVRIHGRNIHRGEFPPGRGVRNAFPAPGPTGAEESKREEYQILAHSLERWSHKVTKKWLVL